MCGADSRADIPVEDREQVAAVNCRVRAGYIVPDKTVQWKEGINVSLTVIGGTASSSTGTTGASGYFTPTIIHDGVSTNIIVTVVATDSGGRLSQRQ